MATLYPPTWYTARPGPLPAAPAGRRPHLSYGATSTPSGAHPSRPDGLGHPTSTRRRRPGRGRRGIINTLLRASTIFNKACSNRGLSRPVDTLTSTAAAPSRRRAPSSRTIPTPGQAAVGSREATPRSRDRQSHQGGGNPCDSAWLAGSRIPLQSRHFTRDM